MTLADKIKKYNLTSSDWFRHKYYTIITRTGIDKIQAIDKIAINFEAIKVSPEFCVVKAKGVKGTLTAETFGSAKYGEKEWVQFEKPNQYGKTGKWLENGNTTTWYVMEMAEKRAMSRVVLKITGFYELGVFGEDESEEFNEKKTKNNSEKTLAKKVITPSEKLEACKTIEQLQKVYGSLSRTEKSAVKSLKNELKLKLK